MSEELDESKITDCLYREEEIGKTFKKSKMKYIWDFSFKGKKHSVIFFDSKISGRKSLEADGKVHFPRQL